MHGQRRWTRRPRRCSTVFGARGRGAPAVRNRPPDSSKRFHSFARCSGFISETDIASKSESRSPAHVTRSIVFFASFFSRVLRKNRALEGAPNSKGRKIKGQLLCISIVSLSSASPEATRSVIKLGRSAKPVDEQPPEAEDTASAVSHSPALMPHCPEIPALAAHRLAAAIRAGDRPLITGCDSHRPSTVFDADDLIVRQPDHRF